MPRAVSLHRPPCAAPIVAHGSAGHVPPDCVPPVLSDEGHAGDLLEHHSVGGARLAWGCCRGVGAEVPVEAGFPAVVLVDGRGGGALTCPACTRAPSCFCRCALKIFPAKAIFICDNGPWDHPPDRTQEVCEQVSLEFDSTGTEKCVVLVPLLVYLSLFLFSCVQHAHPPLPPHTAHAFHVSKPSVVSPPSAPNA